MNSSPLNLRALQSPRGPGNSGSGRASFDAARLVHVLAAAVAVAIAAYLTNEKWQGRITNLAGCGGEEGCSQLLGGRWANWLLVPVSFWALTVYLPLLVLGLLGLNTHRRLLLSWIGSGILAAAALWFLGLQLFVEHRFCKYCFAMHVCSVTLLATTVLHARRLAASSSATAPGRASKPASARDAQPAASAHAPTARIAWIAGTVAAIALITGQLLGPQPATHQLTQEASAASPAPASSNPPADTHAPAATPTKPTPTTNSNSNAPAADASNETRDSKPSSATSVPATNPRDTASDAQAGVPSDDELPDLPNEERPAAGSTAEAAATAKTERSDATDRRPPAAEPSQPPPSSSGRPMRFLDGALIFNLQEMPHLGSVQAPSVVVKYFDYTCKSCRTMHDELEAIQKRYPGQLAVVVLPCPLDRNCNPAAPPGPAHRDACVYARLALAVWQADRTKFTAYHETMFGLQGQLTPAIARQKAVELVGEERLSRGEQDPWIGKTMDQTFSIYRIMARQNPRMPKLVLGGTVILHGVTANQRDLTDALAKYAGMKQPGK